MYEDQYVDIGSDTGPLGPSKLYQMYDNNQWWSGPRRLRMSGCGAKSLTEKKTKYISPNFDVE